jgi:hypothetical protein
MRSVPPTEPRHQCHAPTRPEPTPAAARRGGTGFSLQNSRGIEDGDVVLSVHPLLPSLSPAMKEISSREDYS